MSGQSPANPEEDFLRIEAELLFRTIAIVEALQTQLWGGAFDRESFLEAARLATTVRETPVFEFAGFNPEVLYKRALALLQQ